MHPLVFENTPGTDGIRIGRIFYFDHLRTVVAQQRGGIGGGHHGGHVDHARAGKRQARIVLRCELLLDEKVQFGGLVHVG